MGTSAPEGKAVNKRGELTGAQRVMAFLWKALVLREGWKGAFLCSIDIFL